MIGLHMRWMIHTDQPEVLEIAGCTAYSWTPEQLAATARKQNVIGLVAEDLHGRVVGFAVYHVRRDYIEVLALAVGPYVRRRGVGRALFESLVGKSCQLRRTRMVSRIRETDDVAVRFWKAMGARAMRVDRGYYRDTGEDAYRFERQVWIPAAGNHVAASDRRSRRGRTP